MKLDKVEKQIRKLANLVESLKEDNHVSNIERDLLLSYTRSLYERIMGMADESEIDTGSVKTTLEKKKESIKSPIMEHIVKEEVTSPVRTFRETPVPTSPSVSSERVETRSAATTTMTHDIGNARIKGTSQDIEMSDSMKEIFSESQINELSDRLSKAPIKDLTKCMGINEKIFTIQELFGGDSTLYNTTLERLNSLDSFEAAKSYLVNGVAKDKKWDEGERQKKAINFIKLVQRRFS